MLAAYNSWANSIVVDATRDVRDEAYNEQASASYGSIAATLRHLATAQAVWLSRWTGEHPPKYDLLSRDGFRAAVVDCNGRLERFVASMTEPDWDRVLKYRDSSGNDQAEPMGVLITHVVNHGTL